MGRSSISPRTPRGRACVRRGHRSPSPSVRREDGDESSDCVERPRVGRGASAVRPAPARRRNVWSAVRTRQRAASGGPPLVGDNRGGGSEPRQSMERSGQRGGGLERRLRVRRVRCAGQNRRRRSSRVRKEHGDEVGFRNIRGRDEGRARRLSVVDAKPEQHAVIPRRARPPFTRSVKGQEAGECRGTTAP